MTGRGGSGFQPFLVRSLTTLVIPQGYPLSIAGSFAVISHRFGSPSSFHIGGFVAGAVAAFITLSVCGRRGLSRSPAELPGGLLGLLNVVPIAVLLIVVGVVSLTSSAFLGYPLGGFIAAGFYVLLVSVFFWIVARRKAADSSRLDP